MVAVWAVIRMAAFFLSARFLPVTQLPWRLRLGLPIVWALSVSPLVAGEQSSRSYGPAECVRICLSELCLGLLLGWGVTLLVQAVQLAWDGEITAGQRGTSAVGGFGPYEDSGPGTRFGALLVGAAFFATGLHRQLLAAVCDTFCLFPPGTFRPGVGWTELVADLATSSLRLTLCFAAPLTAVQFVIRLAHRLSSWHGLADSSHLGSLDRLIGLTAGYVMVGAGMVLVEDQLHWWWWRIGAMSP